MIRSHKKYPTQHLLRFFSTKSLDDLASSLFSSNKSFENLKTSSNATDTQISTLTLKLKHPVAIIGSGPAAWTAAIYTSRAGLTPIVLEGQMANGIAAGGQLTTTTDVENYPGFPSILGPDLTELFRSHGKEFGAVSLLETVDNITFSDNEKNGITTKIATTTNGTKIECDALIIATGALAKKLEFQGSETFWTKGISACAVCDGGLPLFRDQVLIVIGGGDTAMEEALFLTRFASKVIIVHRRNELRASKIMADRALGHDKIEFRWDSNVVEANNSTGGDLLESITLDTGEIIQCRGLFFGIGHEPATKFLNNQLVLDENGYVVVEKGKTKTSVDGIFACGDVMDHEYRQAVTAAGTGCMAALEAERWLASTKQ